MKKFEHPVAIDIETVAITELKSLIPQKDVPKHYKDPEKIEGYKKRIKEDALDKMALDFRFGKIICIGICSGNESKSIFNADEKSLLKNFWNEMREFDSFITFNGTAFDIPFLKYRSMFNNIPMSVWIDFHKYNSGNHFDLKLQIENFENFREGTLATYSKLLLGCSKWNELSGKDISDLWENGNYKSIQAYSRFDAEIIWKLFKKIKNHYLKPETEETKLCRI